MLFLTSSEHLELEGAGVDIAYVYGQLDVPILMEQPNISPGNVFKARFAMSSSHFSVRMKTDGTYLGTLYT